MYHVLSYRMSTLLQITNYQITKSQVVVSGPDPSCSVEVLLLVYYNIIGLEPRKDINI